MQTLRAPVHSELVIRKSRFLGCVQPVADRAAALAIVEQLRLDHPGAAHVCWALHAGGQSAANDDGEPGGTAGRPMLEVLRRQDLDGVLATVVRYFGGVKLGAGGLVRAYTDAVAQALLGADKVPVQRQLKWTCHAPYGLEDWVRRQARGHGVTLVSVTHGEAVRFELAGPEDALLGLRSRIDEAGGGRVHWEETGRPLRP